MKKKQRKKISAPSHRTMNNNIAIAISANKNSSSYRPPRDHDNIDHEAAFAQIRTDLIGRLDPVETPFGSKPLVCECVMQAHPPSLSIRGVRCVRYRIGAERLGIIEQVAKVDRVVIDFHEQYLGYLNWTRAELKRLSDKQNSAPRLLYYIIIFRYLIVRSFI